MTLPKPVGSHNDNYELLKGRLDGLEPEDKGATPVNQFLDGSGYRKTVLENGVRVVMEEIPLFNSVSVGVWVINGSRDEKPDENGLSHFVEHLLFKGTETRTAFEIARAIDSVGGALNAFTIPGRLG